MIFQNLKIHLSLIPLLPLLGFCINAVLAIVSSKTKKPASEILVSVVACLFPALSFVLSVMAFLVLKKDPNHLLATGPIFTWLNTTLLHVDFAFLIDPLSGLMILIITGVGSLIHLYATGYMKKDKSFARFFAYLNLFLFFMLLLVLGDNLLLLFVGWEGVGLCSYLLIGFWFDDPEKASAGKKAFVVNRIGDFGFLAGIFLILYSFLSQTQSTETIYLNYAFMEAHKDIFIPLATVITLCLFAGATGKSAQIPLYVWLPDAMAGPTPVSALIHAATMVTAGIYMVIRLHFLFALSPFTLHVIASIGLATAFMAALIGLTQYDIKKVLAYSTVSQLGYMFLAFGSGAPAAAEFHVMTHAFFKACLFLGAGSVIHAVHDQDIRHMGGLKSKMPLTFITFFISTLAIAGIPPFAGFFSKDEILLSTYLHESRAFYIIGLLTAGITSFYMFRLVALTFFGKCRAHHPEHIHESPWTMTFPLIILAILAMVGGFLGVPHVLGGENWIHHWLEKYSLASGEGAVEEALEKNLMVVSTAWAALTGGLALFLYSRNIDWAKNFTQRISLLYRFINKKYYVDEVYKAVFVTSLAFISRVFLWKGVDQALVDGVLVHGGPDVAKGSAKILSKIQSGLLSHYLLYFWGGLILFLCLAVK